jgi:hypothetical protein
MKKQANAAKKLWLSRESIRMLETVQPLGAVRGASGEDCSSQFRNCPTTVPTR